MSYQPNMNEFFQWKHHPFTDARPVANPYMSSSDQLLLKTSNSLLSLGKSFVITGPSGTGKTTLVRQIITQLDNALYHPIFLHYAGLKRSGILKALADLLGVDPSGRQIPLLTKLQKHIYQLAQQSHAAYPILFIDDIHLMDRETLLDLCSLLVIPGNNRPAASLGLIGDPTFQKTLNLHVMAPVKTRLTAHFQMQPLSNDEGRAFVELRLEHAKAPKGLFESDALELILAQVAGNRRELMNICTLLLEEAFSRGEKTVGTQLTLTHSWINTTD